MKRFVRMTGDGPRVTRTAPGESVTSRALSVLDAFDEQHAALTLSQVARRSGLPVATAHRRLADLVASRLLHRRADGRYEIGARMWHLGLLSRPTTMREAALPHLQDLVTLTGLTAHVAVLDGLAALVVDRIGGSRAVLTRHSPGGRLPLYCTAVGKVLLAFAPVTVQDQALRALVAHTSHTITDPGVVRRQIREIDRTRLASSRQEHRDGVASIAVPVFRAGAVVAAIGLLAPLRAGVDTHAEALRSCSAQVARSLAALERVPED
jgi:DNA-binding IclR family transcriptional regulator